MFILIWSHCGWGGRCQQAVCVCERKCQEHLRRLLLQEKPTNLSRCVEWNPDVCIRGRSRGTDAGISPINPLQFHICYKSVESEVNVKTLQINPESDRSSISCQRYHFPSKWYGWQFDNCHPDLASLKHSPKTHQILQGRWDEITNSRNLPSLSKNTAICRDVYKRRYASCTST